MKKITHAKILGELVDKFGLEDLEREVFTFGENVVPIYDIGAHVKNWITERDRKPVTANGLLEFDTVLQDERHKLRRLGVLHETGANFDIDQVYIGVHNPVGVSYLFYDTTNPIVSGTVKIFEFRQDIPMKYGERIHINVSNFVTGGYVSLHTLYEQEIIR